MEVNGHLSLSGTSVKLGLVHEMTPNMENLVQIRDLSVTYFPATGDPVQALRNFNLDVRGGEIIGVFGESGCGKTSLANAILRLLANNSKYEQGQILFRGRDLLTLSESELNTVRGREIAMVAQDPALSLNPVMTAGNQVAEVLRAHTSLGRAERRQRVNELLSDVGFDQPGEIYEAYPHQLSGGQRQRVVIAQAVACQPSFIIADEPTSKLDPSLRAEIMSLLSKMREQFGIAILLISHDLTSFIEFADRIVTMYAGRIVESGNCKEIFARPFHPYTQTLVGIAKSGTNKSFTPKSHFPFIEGDASDSSAKQIGCRFERRCNERMEICTSNYPPDFSPEAERSVSCFKYAE